MVEFFKTSTMWVVDFRYDGSPRRWFKAFGPDVDVASEMATQLSELYGVRVRLEGVRKASEAEESAYLRGDTPKNVFCPTGRGADGPSGDKRGGRLPVEASRGQSQKRRLLLAGADHVDGLDLALQQRESGLLDGRFVDETGEVVAYLAAVARGGNFRSRS